MITKRNYKKAINDAHEATNASLFWNIGFWLKQWNFLVTLILAAVFIVIVFFFSKQDWSGISPYASLGIYSMVLWGAYVTMRIICNLEIEYAIVSNVQETLDSYKADGQRKDIEKLEIDLLPNNRQDPPPQTIQMFRKIIKEAKDHRFDTNLGAVTPYQEALINQLFDLKSIQTLGLRVGIMGTFLGLLYGLAEFSGMFQTDMKFTSSAEGLIDALRIAFGTSVAGLVVSVVLAIFIMQVRSHHEILFRAMESVAVDMISTASNAVNTSTLYGQEIRALRHAITKQQESTHELSLEVENASSKVAPWVKQQRDILDQGIDKLIDGKNSFEEYLEAQNKKVNEFSQVHLSTVKSYTERLDKFNSENELLLKQNNEALKNEINSIMGNLEHVIKHVDQTSQKIIHDSTNHLSLAVLALQDSLKKHPAEELNKKVDHLAKNINVSAEGLFGELQLMRNNLNDNMNLSNELVLTVKNGIESLERKSNISSDSLENLMKEIMEKQNKTNLDQMREFLSSISELKEQTRSGLENIPILLNNQRYSAGQSNLKFSIYISLIVFTIVWFTWLQRPDFF